MKYPPPSFIVAGFAAIVMFCAGCQKEPVAPISDGRVELGIAKESNPRTRTLVKDDETGEHSCPTPASNCTKVTMLVPNDDHGVGAVLYAIDGGVQQDIIDAFETWKSELEKVMDEADIDAVIEERYTAQGGFNRDGTRFVILTSSSGVAAAYPFQYEE